MEAITTKIGFIPAAEDLTGMVGRAVAINGFNPEYKHGLWQLPRTLKAKGIVTKGAKTLDAPAVVISGVTDVRLSATSGPVSPGDSLTWDTDGYLTKGGAFATALGYGDSGKIIPAFIFPTEESGIGGKYVEGGRYSDTTTQTVTGPDILTPVLYGPGGTDNRGIATMDTEGVITLNKSGPAFVKLHFRVGRTGASGTSKVVLKSQVSVDGGASWQFTENDVFSASLHNSTDIEVISEQVFINGLAGFKFRTVWARDSTGDNSGNLEPLEIGPNLQVQGLSVQPSARMVVYFDEEFVYY